MESSHHDQTNRRKRHRASRGEEVMASDFDDEYLSEMIHNPSEDDVRRALAKELLARRSAEEEPVGFIESKVGSERYIFRCYSGYVINCHDDLYRKPFSE